ncbi:MAG: BACON domain-containing protein, partial [Bacteroidales bacterium]|nr:BACON domain-containing protein [Bacteroidales bacterium]
TATVRYNGTDHTVTIIQSALEFSITTDTPPVNYNATTATVTVHAEEGKSWTATITGPNGVSGYSLSETSGTGSKTLTVTLPANNTANARNYTIRATQTDPAGTATLVLTQRRQPNASSSFSYDQFGITQNNHSGESTSSDGYITVSFGNSTRQTGWYNSWNYIRMSDGNAYGYATITPNPGVRITRVEVTGTNGTNAGRIRVSSGTYSNSGATRTWTVSSTEPITMTSTSNAGNGAQIQTIVVYYEPI